jgi:hypothetical protein
MFHDTFYGGQMRRFPFVVLLGSLFLSCTTAEGQDFSGSYTYRDESVNVKLTLRKSAGGEYRGSIAATEGSLDVVGKAKNGVLRGAVGDDLDAITFEARLNQDELSFVMVELNDNGSPMSETAQTYVFKRASSARSGGQETQKKSNGKVIINDVVLSGDQIAELTRTYGVKALPGNYWYDAKCGLYGVVGYPAFGFMRPGHQFGTLKRDASQGNTNAFVNGRELPLAEYTVWSYMVGAWIQPGEYWLDAQGNAGYEGNPAPVINLYTLGKQNSYRGQGGSGDNFWSSRFSAGNYDSGNTRGYVSVPGYGPVGYGF